MSKSPAKWSTDFQQKQHKIYAFFCFSVTIRYEMSIYYLSMVESSCGYEGFLQYSQAQSDLELYPNNYLFSFEMVRLIEEANCNNCLTPPWSWEVNIINLGYLNFNDGLLIISTDLIRKCIIWWEKLLLLCIPC